MVSRRPSHRGFVARGHAPHPAAADAVRIVLVSAALVAAASGCRLVNRGGAVAPELADARRLCNEGLSAADRDDLGRAEALLARAVKRCPGDVDARRHYADVLWRHGDRTEAIGQIAAALELSPADAGLCIEAGRMYLDLGLLNDAERLAAEAVRLAPRTAGAWRLHGQVAMARGQFEAAVADLHRALAIDGDDGEALADTARAYLALGRPRRVLATLAVLDEGHPADGLPGDLLALEARAEEALGRPTEAAAAWRRALAKGGAPPDAAARLAALEAGVAPLRR
ncbi:MAG: tetratricopeptide repeat protein [Planctomycetaceae bacterium]